MKNNVNIYTTRPATLTSDLTNTLKQSTAELYAAKAKAKKAKTAFYDALCAELKANPGMTVLCKDVAAMAGLLPTQVGTELSQRRDKGIRPEYIEVSRTYAEIDDNGNLVKDGEVKTINKTFTGYRAKTPNDRW